MLRFKTFGDPVYCRPFNFAIGPLTELDAWIKREFPGAKLPASIDETCNGAHFHLVAKDRIREDVIWVRMFDGSIADTGRLVHECVHAAFSVFNYIGADDHDGGNEPFAYYTEYLFEECLKAIRGFRAGKKKSRRNQSAHSGKARRTKARHARRS